MSLNWFELVTVDPARAREAIVPPEAAPLMARAYTLLTELRDWSHLPPIPANEPERERRRSEILRLHDQAAAVGWQPGVSAFWPRRNVPEELSAHLIVSNGPATVLYQTLSGDEAVAPADTGGSYAFRVYPHSYYAWDGAAMRVTRRDPVFLVVVRDGFEPFLTALLPVWPEPIPHEVSVPHGLGGKRADAPPRAVPLRPWTGEGSATSVPAENAYDQTFHDDPGLRGSVYLTVTLEPVRRR